MVMLRQRLKNKITFRKRISFIVKTKRSSLCNFVMQFTEKSVEISGYKCKLCFAAVLRFCDYFGNEMRFSMPFYQMYFLMYYQAVSKEIMSQSKAVLKPQRYNILSFISLHFHLPIKFVQVAFKKLEPENLLEFELANILKN